MSGSSAVSTGPLHLQVLCLDSDDIRPDLDPPFLLPYLPCSGDVHRASIHPKFGTNVVTQSADEVRIGSWSQSRSLYNDVVMHSAEKMVLGRARYRSVRIDLDPGIVFHICEDLSRSWHIVSYL